MQSEHRDRIKREVDQLVTSLAAELSVPAEAVADVAYLHIQKHSGWGRNPSKAQKRAAHQHWDGACQHCNEPVTLSEAVFHHVKRRVTGQHQPANLLPYHEACHDQHHGVVEGSLSKGTPRGRGTSDK
jgi:5-methylcytosine-specific restriction endonuclease McrA